MPSIRTRSALHSAQPSSADEQDTHHTAQPETDATVTYTDSGTCCAHAVESHAHGPDGSSIHRLASQNELTGQTDTPHTSDPRTEETGQVPPPHVAPGHPRDTEHASLNPSGAHGTTSHADVPSEHSGRAPSDDVSTHPLDTAIATLAPEDTPAGAAAAVKRRRDDGSPTLSPLPAKKIPGPRDTQEDNVCVCSVCHLVAPLGGERFFRFRIV